MSAAPLRFQKGTALGNDYIVIDAADLTFDLTPARARLLCDRHQGIGSDGILLANLDHAKAAGAVALRIINPDGSEAEKSGNGLRIFGAYLHRRGIVDRDAFNVKLPRDTVSMRVEGVLSDGVLDIKVDMGVAKFDPADVAFKNTSGGPPYRIALDNGGSADVVLVSIGNPHCVVFVGELDRADFLARAPQLCAHTDFAHGTNVQFARVAGGNVEAWIWERGAGETMASGSSASAVCAAAVSRGLLRPGSFQVRMPGGTAEVDVDADYTIRLRGPAQILYEGVLSESLQVAVTA